MAENLWVEKYRPRKIDDCIFARMTGSGSCCYAVFTEKEHALKAKININNKFSNLWSYLGKNNAINN